MNLRKERLKKSRLYLILDKEVSGNRLFSILRDRTFPLGVDIIQFRDKKSKKEDILRNALLLNKLFLKRRVLFIINDYLDVAKIVASDGLHLGQHDASVRLARRILGKNKIIGVSCHNLKQALKAQKDGADYIGFGPLFPTPTKPEYKTIGLNSIGHLKERIKIPFFAIGNINKDNLTKVISAGARKVAVCRAILKAGNITESAKYFSKGLS